MPLQRRLPEARVQLADPRPQLRGSSVRTGTPAGRRIDLLALRAAGVVPADALSAKVILPASSAARSSSKGVGATKGAKAAIEAAGGSDRRIQEGRG